MKLTIIDVNPAIIDVKQRLGAIRPNIEIASGDVFATRGTGTLVSPANAYGIMRGGFDAVIAKHIPGIEKTVQNEIKRKYPTGIIPLGQSVLVNCLPNSYCHYLICCPVMKNPGTQIPLANVTKAALGLFRLLRYANQSVTFNVVMTPLGTGVGGVDLDDSVNAILDAYDTIFL
jgi:O-acetyl-ADP-ribose deacetylase (regulator of RNase III)